MFLKRYAITAALFLLTSCFSRSTMMTMQTYDDVQVGSPIADVIKKNGEPSIIDYEHKPNEYKYVEKITNGNRLLYEMHYTIFVQDGKVVGKTSVQERLPAYDLIYQDDPNHNQYP